MIRLPNPRDLDRRLADVEARKAALAREHKSTAVLHRNHVLLKCRKIKNEVRAERQQRRAS